MGSPTQLSEEEARKVGPEILTGRSEESLELEGDGQKHGNRTGNMVGFETPQALSFANRRQMKGPVQRREVDIQQKSREGPL